MKGTDTMEDKKSFEMSDDILDNVAGGSTAFAEGSSVSQVGTVPVVQPPILLHPDPRPKDDDHMHIVPGIVGHNDL